MRVTVRSGQTVVIEKAFSDELINIGRDWANHLQLPDRRVARQHALLVKRGGQWCVQPEDRNVLVLVNREKITGERPLLAGDVITIEQYDIEFDPEGEAGAASPPVAATEAPAAPTIGTAAVVAAATAAVPMDALVHLHSLALKLSAHAVEEYAGLSVKLGACADVGDLLSRLLDHAQAQFKAGAVYVQFRLDLVGKPVIEQGRNSRGQAMDPPAMANRLMPAVIERKSRILVGHDGRQPPNALCVPMICALGCIGTLYLEAGDAELREVDLDHAAALAAVYAAHLERLLTLRSPANGGPGEGSGQWAGPDWVKLLLPAGVPRRPEAALASLRKPGQRTSDWFDFLALPDGRLALCLVVADDAVTLPVVVGQARAAFRLGQLHSEGPHVLLRELHWLLSTCRACPGALDAVVVTLEPKSGQVQFAAAGRPLAWIVTAGGEHRPLASVQPALAADRRPVLDSTAAQVPHGTAVLLCSPGIGECRDASGVPFGIEHVLGSVADGCGDAPNEVLNDLAQDLQAHLGGAPAPHDISLVLVARA